MSAGHGTEVIIGLDVGTSAAKAVAYGIADPFRAMASRPISLQGSALGAQTLDPAQVIEAAEGALAEVAAACTGRQIVGICLSAAMHGLLGIDADRVPVTPILTWADARAATTWRDLRGEQVIDDLHQQTGTPVHPMSPALKLRWLGEQDPATKARAASWLGIKDWLLLWLTGELMTERSSASASGLLDRVTGAWHARALEFAGIGESQLPGVHSPIDARALSPHVAERTGLSSSVPIILGAADGPLANVGVGALNPSVAALSLGTSGAIRVTVPQQPAQLDPALFCYWLHGGLTVIGGALSTGGVLLPWLGSLLGLSARVSSARGSTAHGSNHEVLELAMSAPPGSDGLVMLAHLLPERAPLWDPDLPGAYLGLRIDHGPAHLARAAVEGVALQFAAIAARLDAVVPTRSIVATGGAFTSPAWAPVLAAALGRPLTVSSTEEGSSLGAAALGLLALGYAEDLPACRDLLSTRGQAALMVEPDPAYVRVLEDVRSRAAELIEALGPVPRLLDQP